MNLSAAVYELFWSPANPAYRTEIFPVVGVSLLVTVIVSGLLFYIILGRGTPGWHLNEHWWYTFGILAVVNTLILLFSVIGTESVDLKPFVVYFILMNALYNALLWLGISVPLKKFSVLAKETPGFLP